MENDGKWQPPRHSEGVGERTSTESRLSNQVADVTFVHQTLKAVVVMHGALKNRYGGASLEALPWILVDTRLLGA